MSLARNPLTAHCRSGKIIYHNIMYSRLASLISSLSEFKNRDQGHHVCRKKEERCERNEWGWKGSEWRGR